MLPLTLAGGGVVTALGVLWRRPLREAVGAGLAVAVAAVPEGLPLVATVAQQAAARRLSRRGAVVRSARVLEALGRVDTVCFDKTGTLTENRLRVARLVPLGDGLDEDGLLRLAAAAVGNGDDQAHETDRAVVEAARERGVAADGDADASLPFAAGRGFSAALRDGRLVVKGAPEVVLRRCTADDDLRQRVQELAGEGLRVLAVADRAWTPDRRPRRRSARTSPCAASSRLADTRPGVVGRRDRTARSPPGSGSSSPPATTRRPRRPSPRRPGSRTPTASSPGRSSPGPRTPSARAWSARRRVFARLSPEQKVALVTALRRAGATLAMTGDGVNDAAAIRLADVGVGVAGAESPAARTAADIVLTDLDLTRLVDAIAEGRAMWSRVRDAVSILVGGNAGEVAFTVLGTAFGGRAPLGTRQLLLVNLLTDMFPALAVAVATPRAGVPEDGEGPLAGHPLQAVLLAGPHRGFTTAVRRMVLDPRGGDDRRRHRRLGGRAADRAPRPGQHHGSRRADHHPARADGVGRAPQPAGARDGGRVAGRARRRRPDAGAEPVLRVHAAGPRSRGSSSSPVPPRERPALRSSRPCSTGAAPGLSQMRAPA